MSIFTSFLNLFKSKPVSTEPTSSTNLHPEAVALILDFEGIDQPAKWPGESSGITLGHGYDLGFTSAEQLRADWGRHLSELAIKELTIACGVTGRAASRIAYKYGSIKITPAMADEVFSRATLPKWIATTKKTFPGADKLPGRVFGALVSLVFNRGPSLEGSRRSEMRQIHDHVESFNGGQMKQADAIKAIAHSINMMQRLWPDTKGLQRRRRAEADLVLSAL